MLAIRIPQFLRAAVVAVALLGVACQTAPVQEMSDARQAISAARDAGAEQHAASLMQTAVGHLQSAERWLNERKFSQARLDAVRAKNNALDALRVTESSTKADPH